MRIVLDTNIIVSGILSATGASRAVLDRTRREQVEILSSPVLLEELEDVLSRFMPRLAATEVRSAVEEIVYLVHPKHVPIVTRGPDDDHVPAAAVTGRATHIVTRDHDLIDLGSYEGIQMLEPAPMLKLIRTTTGENESEP